MCQKCFESQEILKKFLKSLWFVAAVKSSLKSRNFINTIEEFTKITKKSVRSVENFCVENRPLRNTSKFITLKVVKTKFLPAKNYFTNGPRTRKDKLPLRRGCTKRLHMKPCLEATYFKATCNISYKSSRK